MPKSFSIPWYYSIRVKLLVFGITMSIFPLMLLGLYYIQVTWTSMEDSLLQQHRSVALRVTNSTSDLVRTIQNSLETTALVTVSSLVEEDRRALEHSAYSLLKRSPHIEELTIVSAAGTELVRVSKRTTVSEAELTTIYNTPLFKAVLDGEVYFSDVELGSDHQVFIKMAIPVGNVLTGTQGAYIAKISLRQIMEEISSIAPADGRYVMLINQDGKLIGHSDHSQVLRGQSVIDSHVVPLLTSCLSSNTCPEQYYRTAQYTSYTGQEVIGVYGKVPYLDWGIVIEQSRTDAYASLNRTLYQLAAAAIATMLVTTLLSIYFARIFLSPLSSLSTGVKRAKDGDLAAIIKEDYRDEIGQIIRTFNELTLELHKKREHEKIVIQAEKKAAIGQLAAGVAHEINNPMNNLNYYATDLLERLEKEDIHELYQSGVINEYLRVISTQIDRCSAITKNLLNFARESTGKISAINIVDVLEDTLVLLQHRLRKQKVEIIREFDILLPTLNTDASLLQQIFLNTLTNSLDAMKKGGKITITITYDNEIEIFNLIISDSGIGIPDEIINNIFDPFYTTKPFGEGTGLGLSITHSIVQRLRGTIMITSRVNYGTRVTIKLPMLKLEDTREDDNFNK